LDAQKIADKKLNAQNKFSNLSTQQENFSCRNNLMQISQNIPINLKSLFSKTYKATKREIETRAYLEQKKK
jgi:hypothetical protein